MSARIDNGWVIVDCDAHDMAAVSIAVGTPDDWTPAFRDFDGETRVAKVPDTADRAARSQIYLRVGDAVTRVGRI